MLFNSFSFFIFFVGVFFAYIVLPHRWQNRMLLVTSYIFYGSWDWRFLSLLFFSTTLDYFFALKIGRSDRPGHRRNWMMASLIVNLSILGFFKYFNFFAGSFAALMQKAGLEVSPLVLNVVLPVGISFYTFQALSYTIDVYRGILKPADRWSDFALYVAFFPQLVAGPIERATNLLPQVQHPRTVSDYGIGHGAFLILWGLFQKVVIADNISGVADEVFASNPGNGAMVLVGVYAFALQIYCDFSGYSNMARGLALMLGFRLMLNFKNPYLASDPSDFWRRWHISLSTWLRDYLYIGLGGNRKGTLLTYRNLLLTMVLGGLWHGAAWTFIVWGIYHGLLLVVHRFWKTLVSIPAMLSHPWAAKSWRATKIILFFHLICLGWLFFRATSMTQVAEMLSLIGTHFAPQDVLLLSQKALLLVYFGVPLLLMELWQYRSGDPLVVIKAPRPMRVLVYVALVYGIVIFAKDNAQSFIYFQF